MAVDRGGLRYTIEVRDRFSAPLKKFRAEIRAARQELEGLRTAQARLNASRRQSREAVSGQEREQLDRIRRIQSGLRQQAQVEQLRARINRAQQREAAAAARQDIELFRRQAQERERLSRQQEAAGRRAEAASRRRGRAVRQEASGFQVLANNIRNADGAVNRISFTFRRLIGIFAVFAAARAAIQGFRSLISESISFNQTVEDSQIGLASLFTTIGEIRDAQGNLVTGAEAFGAAQQVAAEQTEKLRADAVATVATFEELLRAFQAGVGPGLEAGLNLDEIREVTVRVSQAAAALALPQNQLIEEIRSLLRGTIRTQSTVIASVLGISNDDIKSAKQAGTLFEFLQERLTGFRLAADATQQSFTGLLARIRDAIQIVGGAASLGFFNQLKISLGELGESFIQLERDADNKVVGILPNESLVQAATSFFDSLADSIRRFREGLQQIDIGVFGNLIAALGGAFQLLGSAITGFIQGFATSLSAVASLVGALLNQLGPDGGGLLDIVEQIGVFFGLWLGPIVAVAVTIASMRGLLFLLLPILNAVSIAFRATLTTVQLLAGVIGRLPAAFFPLLGIVLAMTVGFQKLFERILGFPVTIEDTFSIIVLAVQEFLATAKTRFTIAFKEIANLIGQFLTSPLAGFATSLQTILNSVLGAAAVLRSLGVITEEQRQGLEDLASTLEGFASRNSGTNRFSIFSEDNIEKDRENLATLLDESQARFDELAAQIAARNAAGDFNIDIGEVDTSGILGFIDRLSTEFGDLLGIDFDKLSEDFANGLVDPEKVQEKIQEALQEFFVSGRGQGLDGEGEESPLSKFFNGVIENFQNGLGLLRPLVSQFSSFISDSIVDAFDPTNDTDLLERFARFLQSIARLIIQTLVQVAIARAALSLFGTPGLGGGTASGLGFAEGGEIPDGSAAPRSVRPRGIDSRDTTPIWAQPGEWMMKLRAVQKYGVGVMDAINRGLVDPSALRALVGDKHSRRHITGLSSRGPRGYAEGGMIRDAQSERATLAQQRQGSQQSGPTPAFLVANDQTLDKLLRGGDQAFRRYVQDNAAEIDGILRQGRTGG